MCPSSDTIKTVPDAACRGSNSLSLSTILEVSFFIHFDDGFLDNWTTVFPIMKKYFS